MWCLVLLKQDTSGGVKQDTTRRTCRRSRTPRRAPCGPARPPAQTVCERQSARAPPRREEGVAEESIEYLSLSSDGFDDGRSSLVFLLSRSFSRMRWPAGGGVAATSTRRVVRLSVGGSSARDDRTVLWSSLVLLSSRALLRAASRGVWGGSGRDRSDAIHTTRTDHHRPHRARSSSSSSDDGSVFVFIFIFVYVFAFDFSFSFFSLSLTCQSVSGTAAVASQPSCGCAAGKAAQSSSSNVVPHGRQPPHAPSAS